MYYIVFAILYILLVIGFIAFLKRPTKDESNRFCEVLLSEAVKGLTKSDVQSRKKRVKVLPLYQRFLYWSWFTSNVVLIVGFPIMFCLARWLIIGNFVMPNDTVYYELGGFQTFIFGVGGFFLGIPLLVAYSSATNRGFIRKADRLYQLGSFQEYPKKMNVLISGICGLLGLLIMVLPCNSYRYCTGERIAVKYAFSASEAIYEYSDIEYVERETTPEDEEHSLSYAYTIYMVTGKVIKLGENVHNEAVNDVLIENGVRIKEVLSDR